MSADPSPFTLPRWSRSALAQPAAPSWDPYDLWSLPLGIWIRRRYYHGKLLAKSAALALLAVDACAPWVRILTRCRRHHFASVLAQRCLAALLLLQEEGPDSTWSQVARESWAQLLSIAIRPDSDMLCWGLPFHWQSSRQFYPKGTPFITQTAYPLEAAVALWVEFHTDDFADAARAIGRFMHRGIRTEGTQTGAIRCSYGPTDSSFVYNAAAYRAYCLTLLSRHGLYDAEPETSLTWRYLREGQAADGSWMYGEGAEYSYIDHYHTVFVLKALLKKVMLGHAVEADFLCLQRGVSFLFTRLFDSHTGLPLPFAKAPRRSPFSLDGYDMAEATGLLALLLQLDDSTLERLGCRRSEVHRRLERLLNYRVARPPATLWRRCGPFPLYRSFERWAKTPQLLALVLAALSTPPQYLCPDTPPRSSSPDPSLS